MAAKSSRNTKYTQTSETLMSNLQTGEKSFTQSIYESSYRRTIEEKLYRENSLNPCEPKASDTYDNVGNADVQGNFFAPNPSLPVNNLKERDSLQDLLNQIKFFLTSFRSRLSMLIGARGSYGSDNFIGNNIKSNNNIIDISSGQNVSVWNRINYNSYSYEETETMTFETTGQVQTADGRNLDFNMQVEMSREYQETSEYLTRDTAVIMTDPLVISLNSNPVSVSDQKWRFDIDSDGVKDNISLLSKGAGFLAFDRNQDGVINDGAELFGAATGNGFSELAEHDNDGNGWIDENDSIYSKLSVWLKDDDGNDRLIGLKDANVGAIYLGSVSTEFALMSDQDNNQNAQIRRTGAYLTEDGNTKTIQQLDMVKSLIS